MVSIILLMCFLEVKIMIVEATIEIRVNSHYDEPQLSVVVIHVSIPHLCHHLPVATTVNTPDNQFGSSIPFSLCVKPHSSGIFALTKSIWTMLRDLCTEYFCPPSFQSFLSPLLPLTSIPTHTEIVFKFLVFVKKQTE